MIKLSIVLLCKPLVTVKVKGKRAISLDWKRRVKSNGGTAENPEIVCEWDKDGEDSNQSTSTCRYTITWRDVSLDIEVGGIFSQKKSVRTLRSSTGFMRPGESLAVIGRKLANLAFVWAGCQV